MANDPRWIVMEHLARIVMIQERVQIESPQQLGALEKRLDALFSGAEPTRGLGLLIEESVKGARGRVLNPLSWKERPIATILRGAVAFADQVATQVCEPLTITRTRAGGVQSKVAVGPPPVPPLSQTLAPMPHIASPSVSAWERPLQQRLFDNTHAGRVVFDEIDSVDLTPEARDLQLFVTWLVLRLGFAPKDVEKAHNPAECARDVAAQIRSFIDGLSGSVRSARVTRLPPFALDVATVPDTVSGSAATRSVTAREMERTPDGTTARAASAVILMGFAVPLVLLTWLYLAPISASGTAITEASNALHVREQEP